MLTRALLVEYQKVGLLTTVNYFSFLASLSGGRPTLLTGISIYMNNTF